MNVQCIQLTKEQQRLQHEAREFARRELKPLAARWDENEEFPFLSVQLTAAMGYFGLTIPQAYGGRGLGAIEAMLVIEEVAKVCANTAELLFDSILGPMQVVSTFGSKAQKDRFLSPAARGDLIMGIAISEAHAGSSATDMLSRAIVDGDEIILNGRKSHVEDVSTSHAFLVYVKFGDESGAKSIGGVIVERGRPGFSIGAQRKKMGLRGCAQADLIFEDCRIPLDNLLVKPGEFSKLMAAFNLERCGNAITAVGIAAGALEEAISYAKERMQFGRPLCEFQGLQWKIARMAMEVDAARLLVYRAVGAASNGLPNMTEASMAKAYSNEMAIRVTNEALQIFGAAGYLRDRPLERMVRDARGWAIAGGTVEMQLNNIASGLFGRRFNQRPVAAN